MNLSSLELQQVAQALVELDVIRVAEQQPFFYTTGWASPVYIDIRGLMSDVAKRGLILDLAAQALRPVLEAKKINAIVGTEGSGIVFAAWLAERLMLPLVYLRKRAVGWGISARVEGTLPQGGRALLIDDVTTDARSKVDACRALRDCGAEIEDVMVIVNFDIYPQSKRLLGEHRIDMHALLTWPQLYTFYKDRAALTPAQQQALQDFNASPVHWSLEHGGVGA